MLLDDCDKGTWNLSIYCDNSGRQRPDIGRGRDALLCLGRKHRLHSFGYIVYTLPWGGKLG